MTIWADYSAGRPPGSALRAAGFSGVIRYVGTPGRTKNITGAEYADLVVNGLGVLLVFENTTTDVLGGNAAGVNNARAALADARACGIPDTIGIAACADMHLSASQVQTGLAYVDGFREVLGQARTGAYGFTEFVTAVHAAGTTSWLWQCGARPTGAALGYINFWQRNAGQTTMTVAGIVCDINDQLNPVGQVPATVIPRGGTVLIQGSAAKFNTQAMTDGVFKTNLDAATASADATLFPRLLVSDELWDQLEANTNALLASLAGASTLSGTANVTVNLTPKASGA